MRRPIELNTLQLSHVREVERRWVRYKLARENKERQIRAAINAEMMGALGALREDVTDALRAAALASVPKVRLKEATTKDPVSFTALYKGENG